MVGFYFTIDESLAGNLGRLSEYVLYITVADGNSHAVFFTPFNHCMAAILLATSAVLKVPTTAVSQNHLNLCSLIHA